MNDDELFDDVDDLLDRYWKRIKAKHMANRASATMNGKPVTVQYVTPYLQSLLEADALAIRFLIFDALRHSEPPSVVED